MTLNTDNLDSSGKPRGTSEGGGETQTFSAEQVKELTAKAVSDALAQAGRDAKALEAQAASLLQMKQAAEAEIVRLADARKQALDAQYELELKKAGDDDDLIAKVKADYKNRLEALQLDTEKKKLDAQRQAEADKDRKLASLMSENAAIKIGAQYGVSHEQLLKLTDGTPEKMEELAKIIGKAKEDAGQTQQKVSVTKLGTTGSVSTMSYEDLAREFAKNPENPGVRSAYLKKRAERGLPMF